jgi:hypothetical protein
MRLGVLYPSDYYRVFGHHVVDKVLRSEDRSLLLEFKEWLDSVKEGYSTLVLSTETLCVADIEALRDLSDVLSSWNVEVVYFLRKLTGFWPSHWQELVKHGSEITFEEYLLQSFRHGRNFRQFPCQHSQIKNLIAAFGEASVKVIAYDNIVAENIDLYDYFLRDLIGVDVCTDRKSMLLNASMTPTQLEIIRNINMKARELTGMPIDREIRKRFIQSMREIEEAEEMTLFVEAFNKFSQSYELSDDFEIIESREKDLAISLGDRIVNRASDESIFFPGPSRKVFFASRYWASSAGQNSYLTELFRFLQAL